MLKSSRGKQHHCYEQDPAVYEPSAHLLQRTRSLPPRSYTVQPRIAEITGHLYLCSAKSVTKGALLTLGISHVINCTSEIPQVAVSGVKTTRISVEDKPRSNLSKYFTKVSDKIHKEFARGGKILIHCYAGVSRSASLCMAYLMRYYRLTLKKAYLHIQRHRPHVNPNSGFWQQLIDYERKLFGFNSVAMVTTPNGILPDIYLQPHLTANTKFQHYPQAPPAGSRILGCPRRTFMVTLV